MALKKPSRDERKELHMEALTSLKNQAAAAVKRSRVIVLVFFVAVAAWGQIDRGTIGGLVKDQSGLAVPSAKVQVIRIDTNSALDLETNMEGLYTVPNLPAAVYRVVFQKAGFGSVTREPVEVRPRMDVRVDVTLQPGAVTQSVTVTADTPMLDTSPVNNATGLKDEMIQQLPMINIGSKRDMASFLNNLPGTTSYNAMTPSVNGAQVAASETFIDGAPASQRLVPGDLQEVGPVYEQVGELNIVANAFNAEYGGFGAWFANITIKSGTNQLHGSVFEHLGNDKLNARMFFATKRPAYRQNEGGFTLGGPLVIPHVYNGRDKTFFFGSLGLFYSRAGASGSLVTIPTQAFLQGNFSGLTSGGVQVPIFDPDTTAPDGKGGFSRTQFPGNVIPPDRIIYPAKVVAQYMPAPTQPGAINNFNSLGSGLNQWWYDTFTPLIKIDHSISSKQKIMASYTNQPRPRIIVIGGGLSIPPSYNQKQTNPLDFVNQQDVGSWKARFSHDYVVSPSMVNHVVIGADQYHNFGVNGTDGQGWVGKLGIKGIPYDNGQFPQFSFSGGAVSPTTLGLGYDDHWREFSPSVNENLTWLRGKHTMKYGLEIQRDTISRLFAGARAGSFTFTNSATSQPNSTSYGAWGNSYASFLLGAVGTATTAINPEWRIYRIRYGVFAQDEWRATQKFTLSYGLRWDYDPPFSEQYDQISAFLPGLTNPEAGGRAGALAFIGTGSGRIGGDFQDPWKKGFAPRLGVAYQADSKTVIRASSGIYFANSGNAISITPNISGFGVGPSFSSPDGYTPLYNLATGAFPQNFSRPPSLDPSFSNGLSINYIPRTGARLAQTISYTFGIQRELVSHTTIEANYIGSSSTHQWFTSNYNYMPVSGLQYGSLLLQNITSAAAVAAGFSSPYPKFSSQLGANTVYQSLRPYPQYTAVTSGSSQNGVADPVGRSKYNSLQVKANRRFSDGLTLLGFVTWTKSFTMVTDQYPGQRLMQLDAQPAFTFSVSWAYDLPFGEGKRLLNTNSRVLNAVVSGWKVNGFLKYNSGVPLSISGGAGSLAQVGYTQRGNAVPGVSPYLVTNPRDFDPATNKYLNSAAFTTSTGFNFGNLAPTLSWVRGFWGKQEALTAGRVFKIRERLVFDFSLDASNPFNFVRWSNPNTTLVSAAFGKVTAAQNGRAVQINGVIRF
jgi:hypothetical protein